MAVTEKKDIESDDNPAIGGTIRILRKRIPYRQVDICNITGISKGNFSNIESGKVTPTTQALEKITEALGIKMSELFAFHERRQAARAGRHPK
jgi:transcriptional regulator with XRE-family HTH domain